MECRLDIFLWRLKFFNNIYECRKALDKHEILVNGRFLGWNTFLQKGDIIEVNSIFNAKAIRSKTFSLSFFNSFIETDYYTGNVVILKDLKELNLNDLSLFVPKRLNLDQIYKSILW
jgi:ribosomal protein S4